jgi:hypothetical protein
MNNDLFVVSCSMHIHADILSITLQTNSLWIATNQKVMWKRAMIHAGQISLAVFLACILSMPLAAQIDPADTLSGDEIIQAIAGSTLLVTVMGGDQYQEYFAPNGSITMTGDGDIYDGTWRVIEDEICMKLAFGSNDGCWRVALDGDAITLIGQDGAIDYEKQIIARGRIAEE